MTLIGAWTSDAEMLGGAGLFAAIGFIWTAWLILAKADRNRFTTGDFWIAAAWLMPGAALVLSMPYVAGALLTPAVGLAFACVLPAVTFGGFWLASDRQQLSPRARTRLLRAASLIAVAVGVIVIAVSAAWLTDLGLVVAREGAIALWLIFDDLAGFGLTLLGLVAGPSMIWLGYRFERRLRNGRRTR
ncbi:hypothetical protein [Phenylobacterium sp.]|uniref:hypothetical protein n=1 Tax=Phenylobacterium sp. TaxID=1871053 RepID=UPI003783A1A0